MIRAHLGDIILKDAPLNADPRSPLHSRSVLHHSHDVGHLPNGYHLLLPSPQPQVANVFNGLLHVLLFEGLDVDITF